MQPTCLTENVGSGTEVEMVCVAEYDTGVYIVVQLALVDTFHTADSADGHEDRCWYGAVVGSDFTGTGVCSWCCCL